MAKSELKGSATKQLKKAAAKCDKAGEVVDFSDQKKRKKAKTEVQTGFGTTRGLESMFRNAYRAQLDMITLAATKANIMISVNGSLLALLTLSSAYVLTNEPRLLISVAIFLASCVISIFFAVMAARPQKIAKTPTGLDDFRADRADLLVFEHFAKLSRDDYMTAMTELMRDKERIYKAMVGHLYFLGRSADRRFRLLRVSYTAFFVGLVISLAAFLVMTFALTQ